MQVVGERALERSLEEDARLLEPVALRIQERLAGQRLCEHLRQPERLGQLQGHLEPRGGEVVLLVEDEKAAELRGGVGDVPVRLLAGKRAERGLEPRDRLRRMAVAEVDLGEVRRDPGGRAYEPLGLEDGERLLEERSGLESPPPSPGHAAGVLVQFGFRHPIVLQPRRLGEVALSLLVGAERRGALSGAGKLLSGLPPDLDRVGRVGSCLVGGEVVRGDDLDHLLLGGALLEEGGGSEVSRLPVGLGEGVVGDLAQQVLEEPVLPMLGRARIRLDAEDLLAGERREDRLELGRGQLGQRGERLLRERLAEDGSVLDDATLGRRKPSRRAAIRACSVSGTSSDSIVPVGR